jgi:hypothetical protein
MGHIPTKTPSVTPKHFYQGAVNATKVEVCDIPSNCYGFEVENNDTADVFLQVFNKAAADVTVGTTAPDYTFRIPASSNFGKDSQIFPIHYHDLGLVIAVTTTRTGSSNPGTAATVQIWFSK